MQITTEKCSEVRNLRNFAHSLRTACETWSQKYLADSHCDKKNFAFRLGTPHDGLAAFTVTVHLESYAGYYGNSSVSRVFNFDQKLVDRYFASAIEQHKQAIFDSMAAMAEADAVKSVDAAKKEVAAIEALLAEVSADPALTEQVAA